MLGVAAHVTDGLVRQRVAPQRGEVGEQRGVGRGRRVGGRGILVLWQQRGAEEAEQRGATEAGIEVRRIDQKAPDALQQQHLVRAELGAELGVGSWVGIGLRVSGKRTRKECG